MPAQHCHKCAPDLEADGLVWVAVPVYGGRTWPLCHLDKLGPHWSSSADVADWKGQGRCKEAFQGMEGQREGRPMHRQSVDPALIVTPGPGLVGFAWFTQSCASNFIGTASNSPIGTAAAYSLKPASNSVLHSNEYSTGLLAFLFQHSIGLGFPWGKERPYCRNKLLCSCPSQWLMCSTPFQEREERKSSTPDPKVQQAIKCGDCSCFQENPECSDTNKRIWPGKWCSGLLVKHNDTEERQESCLVYPQIEGTSSFIPAFDAISIRDLQLAVVYAL